MKLTKAVCTMALLSTIAWTSNASGENNAPQGQFAGGGYRVETGNTGVYFGYDRQGRKLVISGNRSSTHGKTARWKNNGYIYQLTGSGKSPRTIV
jgi:hypothetical protein